MFFSYYIRFFQPTDKAWWSLIVYLSGKFSITIAYSSVYIYVSEVFPTNVRQSLLAVCSSTGRIGSTLAPLTPLLVSWTLFSNPLLAGLVKTKSGTKVLEVFYITEIRWERFSFTVPNANWSYMIVDAVVLKVSEASTTGHLGNCAFMRSAVKGSTAVIEWTIWPHISKWVAKLTLWRLWPLVNNLYK